MSQHFFSHSHALVDEGAIIGEGTRIWAFAHILPGAIVGKDCNICDHTFVEGNVILGDHVTIKSGVYLWSGLRIENHVFIGPCAAFTNDRRPRSQQYLADYPITTLKEGCSIGANATILPGISIGKWALVGAGSVVTKSVPDFAMVYGNPARIQGWVCQCGAAISTTSEEVHCDCGNSYFYDEQEKKMRIKNK